MGTFWGLGGVRCIEVWGQTGTGILWRSGQAEGSRGTSPFTSSTPRQIELGNVRLLKMTGPHRSARIVTQMEICSSPSKSPGRLLPPAWSQLCPPRPPDSALNGKVLDQRQFRQIVRAEGGSFRAACNLLSMNRGRDKGVFSHRGPD